MPLQAPMDQDLEDDFDLGDTSEVPDPLDADNFNAVDYINKKFPNEVSLNDLDDFVDNLKGQQKQIDEDIRFAVRRQAACGRRARADLDEAKSAVRELFERIKAIKGKAQQSETLVSDVCRDIKSLDIAKRNLTQTVTALKRLVMLVQALEQLRALSLSRQYQEASRLIHAIEELASHFQELSRVPRVADLLERKAAILSDLRSQLLEDYASLLGPAHAREKGVEFARYCVDAMGPVVRRDVITAFCLRILEDYKEIFQPPKEASGLESAERRYKWLKRTLREFEEKYDDHFPQSWRVPCGLCEHFCHVTRQHLVEVLSMTHHTVDPELMVKVLRLSIKEENDLARKYPVDDIIDPAPADTSDYTEGAAGFGFKYPDVIGKAKGSGNAPSGKQMQSGREDPTEFAPRFRGIISECFDAYLGSWVQHEEKQLLEKLDQITAPGSDKIVGQDAESYDDEEEGGLEPRYLYTSARDFFAEMKGSMTKCQGFSTHQTLFDVFQVFRKVIAQYAEKLNSQLPAKVSAPLDSTTVQGVCCVIGTAQYTEETLPQLQDSLQRTIDHSFAERVTFSAEEELLTGIVSKAMQVLVLSVNSSLDEAFAKMTDPPGKWAQYSQDVGDQSAYVSEISERLSRTFEPIAQYLSKLHYRFFCNKFVQAFVARFINEIFRCKKISEQGAQQLLLDTSSIKTSLLEVPVIAGKGRQLPTAYSNYVLREMGRAETMLKVLGSPHADASTLRAMLGDDGEGALADIDRLLALRATEGEGAALGGLQEEGGADASGINALFGAGRSNMLSMADSLKQQQAKTSEDLKALSKDVKKKFFSGFPGKRG
jgi:hypothetical protein